MWGCVRDARIRENGGGKLWTKLSSPIDKHTLAVIREPYRPSRALAPPTLILATPAVRIVLDPSQSPALARNTSQPLAVYPCPARTSCPSTENFAALIPTASL